MQVYVYFPLIRNIYSKYSIDFFKNVLLFYLHNCIKRKSSKGQHSMGRLHAITSMKIASKIVDYFSFTFHSRHLSWTCHFGVLTALVIRSPIWTIAGYQVYMRQIHIRSIMITLLHYTRNVDRIYMAWLHYFDEIIFTCSVKMFWTRQCFSAVV